MVRSMSSNSRPDTLVQDRTTQPHRFLLQRTADPYIRVMTVIFGQGGPMSALPPITPRKEDMASVAMCQPFDYAQKSPVSLLF